VSELFEEAKILSEKHKIASDQQSQLCFDYAVFADDHQMTLSKSPELERLANYRRAAEQQAAELAATPTQGGKKGTVKRAARSSSLTMAQYQAQKEMREEREALEGVMSERKQFASTALRMYASALGLSDRHDDSATRMVSLWLECDQDDDINEGFRGSLLNVPSHKFVFLNPQLTARLDEPKETKPFNTTLNTLVLRISQQHPFHILYQVITLSDGTDTPGNSRKVVKANLKGRTRAAAAILATISTDEKNTFARTACKEMKLLAQIAIRWCQDTTGVEMKLDTNKEVNIPANASLKKLDNLSIPVPTRPPPVSIEGKYEGIATLARYRVTYALLGGISRPKKMQVVDSNGVTYKEIVS
jgi:ataxia telangiectasia mutated family protein